MSKSLRTLSQLSSCTDAFKQRHRLPAISGLHNSYVVNHDQPFRMAVLGSGPAGFYTAYKVMSNIRGAKVDMYESLPVPFGLVRFGVAPDHPDVKNCQDKFEEVASSSNFNFIGNIDIGNGLPLASLADHYHAILFAYGATKDRKLEVPGENTLKGVYSARDFVGWYNGLPGLSHLVPNLESSDNAVIIGQGNVALDVARTLLTDVDTLWKTDMTDYALQTLSKSRVKRVHVVGRRGPMQAAFTIREVRELLNLPSVSFDPIEPVLLPDGAHKLSRTPKRLVNLLSKGSPNRASSARKHWSLDFLLSPTSFNESTTGSGKLTSINFVNNKYQGCDMHDPNAIVAPSNNHTAYSTGLAFRSIGYKSEPMDGMKDFGIDFDETRGIIPNDSRGRVTSLSSDGTGLPGMYCSGWVKRGPAGVIANTMEDAFGTAEAIVQDWNTGQPFMSGDRGWDGVKPEADKRGLRVVSWTDWKKIDNVEKERGRAKGKEREKLASVEEMFNVLD